MLALLAPLLAAVLAATPIQETAVGQGPVAAIHGSADTLVVPRLFPATDQSPNLLVLDRQDLTIRKSFRVGRRLFDAGVFPQSSRAAHRSGDFAVVALGDQDYVLLIDLNTGRVEKQIEVGNRPSGVTVATAPDGTPVAAVANGSSRDVTLIDLRTDVTTTIRHLGRDPRDAAFHPDGIHLIVAIGGEDALAIVNIRTASVVARVNVGSNPVDVEISPDGDTAVVANVGGNSVSLVDVSRPSQPGPARSLLVGNQPSVIAIDQQRTAYVANGGSGFVTVIDLDQRRVRGALVVERQEQVVSALASVSVSSASDELNVIERGNDARLLRYSLPLSDLQPLPAFTRPGEPGGRVSLDVDEGFGCPGFYTARVVQERPGEGGAFGLGGQFASPQRLLQGAITTTAAFGPDGSYPGYVAFSISNRRSERQRIAAQATIIEGEPPPNAELVLIGPGQNVLARTTSIAGVVQLEAEVPPGFYRIRLQSREGNGGASYDLQVTTRFVDRPGGGFTGGLNFGGLIKASESEPLGAGLVTFCITEPSTMALKASGAATLGDGGAGPLRIEVLDRAHESIREIRSMPTEFPAPTEQDLDNSENIAAAVTHFVDSTSNRAFETGSHIYPYRTLSGAISNVARPGDVIHVKPGIYRAQSGREDFPIGARGHAKHPMPPGVKIVGAGIGQSIIDVAGLQDASGNNLHAMVIGADNVEVSGFTIRGATASGIFVLNARNVVIENNEFVDNRRSGVSGFNASGIVVRNNLFSRNDENGVVFSGAESINVAHPPAGCPDSFGACIIDNYVSDHRADGILVSQGGDYHIAGNTVIRSGVAGIELNNRTPLGQTFRPLVGTIRDNAVVGNGGVQFAFAGAGILVTENATAAVIADNIFSHNVPAGIAIFEDGVAELISGNRVFDNVGTGIHVRKRSQVNEISSNMVQANGLAGVAIDDDSQVTSILENDLTTNGTCDECTASRAGLAVLGGSTANVVQSNRWIGNRLGIQITNASSIVQLVQSAIDGSQESGVLVATGSVIDEWTRGWVNRGSSNQPAISISDSSVTASHVDVIGNGGPGLTTFGANIEAQEIRIRHNGAEGISAHAGSSIAIDASIISGNEGHGVHATGTGTQVTINNSEIRGNGLRGANAAEPASIVCHGTTVQGNARGETLGNTDC